MPKVHKNSGNNSYTIHYKNSGGIPSVKNNWYARNTFDAIEAFEKAYPGCTVTKVERVMVSHLV